MHDLNVVCDITNDDIYVGGICGENDGTIENCRVSGTIHTSSRLLGGITGQNDGTIRNCWVSADISSSYMGGSKNGKVGGIAGENSGTIEYCCMSGNVSNDDADVGGLVGYNNGDVYHCTFYGTRSSAHSQDSEYIGDQSENAGGLYNSFTDSEMATYLAGFSGNNIYRDGIQHAFTLKNYCKGNGSIEVNGDRAWPGKTVTVTATSGNVQEIIAKDGSGSIIPISGNATDGYTFTMPKSNSTVLIAFEKYPWQNHAGTEEDPYLISTTEEWNQFVTTVSYGEEYNGVVVKLNADISVSTFVGSYSGRPFCGTFLGDNHTLTVNINDEISDGIAPFHYIKNATIKNLKVAGTVNSPYMHTAGLVGYADGTNLIEGCVVTATIRSWYNYKGGIVGHLNSTTTIKDCVFAGTIVSTNQNGSDHIGGIWGWSDNKATPILQNCIEAGTYTRINSMHPISLQRNQGSVTDCYYVNPQVGNPDNVCTLGGATRVSKTVPGNAVYTSVTISGYTVFYVSCNISGINSSYNLESETINISPVVKDVNENTLTFGTDYTLTLNGEPVTALPITGITEKGEYTLTFTGQGDNVFTKDIMFTVVGSLAGSGADANNPYIINNRDDWNSFVYYVNNGNSYSKKFVKLNADISVSTMAGSEGKQFMGTFDGGGHTLTFNQGKALEHFTEDYCAPFRYVSGATIRNLAVDGNIYTDQKYAAGLVSRSYGTTNIDNCLVSSVIHSSKNEEGSHGGFVAIPEDGTLNITGCVFNGRLFTTTGTTLCGGFVGWHNGKTINVSNSLYAPDTDITAGEGETAINNGATFVRGGSTGNNCYYTETMGTAQGKQPFPITAGDHITVANAGTVSGEYDTSGLIFYDKGAKFEDVLYAGNGDLLSLTITNDREGYTSTYAASAGTFSGSGSAYTLTMPNSDVTISAEWTPNSLATDDSGNYLISSTDDWKAFCAQVESGNNNGYNGKTVKLTKDIAISTMAGPNGNRTFRGTFDGQGHTLTVSIGSADEPFAEQYCGPFRYTYGATIRNLRTTGNIYTSSRYAGGVVGRNGSSRTTLSNVVSNVTITSTYNGGEGAYHGGLMGYAINATFTGCAFTGKLLGNADDTHHCGGLLGQKSGTSGSNAVFTHCLFAPTEVTVGSNNSRTFAAGTHTLTTFYGCYYAQQLGGAQGTKADAFDDAPSYLDSEVEDYGMMKAHQYGILYGNKYYTGIISIISLANDDDNTTVISDNNGYMAKVTLQDRTLYKDGDWNTLCLPFSIDDFTGTPLEDATVMTLGNSEACETGFNSTTGTLTLEFLPAFEIEAGVPYIVRWEKADGYDANPGNFDIANPVFSGVTIVNEDPANHSSEKGGVSFTGTYSPVFLKPGNKSNLFLGTDNTLYYPNAASAGATDGMYHLNAFCAYFHVTLKDPETEVRAFKLSFGDKETTGIVDITMPAGGSQSPVWREASWYNLDGRRLNGKPSRAGVYIYKGVKRVIK